MEASTRPQKSGHPPLTTAHDRSMSVFTGVFTPRKARFGCSLVGTGQISLGDFYLPTIIQRRQTGGGGAGQDKIFRRIPNIELRNVPNRNMLLHGEALEVSISAKESSAIT